MRLLISAFVLLLAVAEPVLAQRGGYRPRGSFSWSAVASIGAVVGVYLLAKSFPRFFPTVGALLVLAVVSTAVASGLATLGVIAQTAVPAAIFYCLTLLLIVSALILLVRRYRRRRPKA